MISSATESDCMWITNTPTLSDQVIFSDRGIIPLSFFLHPFCFCIMMELNDFMQNNARITQGGTQYERRAVSSGAR